MIKLIECCCDIISDTFNMLDFEVDRKKSQKNVYPTFNRLGSRVFKLVLSKIFDNYVSGLITFKIKISNEFWMKNSLSLIALKEDNKKMVLIIKNVNL